MAIVFTQTDTAAQDGAQLACSGASQTAGGGNGTSQISENATAGSTEQTVKNSSNVTNVAGFFNQSAPGEPGDTSWESGNWVTRINVTTGNTSVTLQEVHVCRVDSTGTNQQTIGSATGLGTSMSAGVHSVTVSGSAGDGTEADTDEVYIVWVFDFGGSHGNQQIGVTPDQNIDSPLSVSSGVSGTAAQTLSILTQSASGGLTFSATASQNLSIVTQSASASLIFRASSDQTLVFLTQSASGSQGETVSGSAAQSLPIVTQSASGGLKFSGTVSQLIAAITQSASGGLAFSGSVAQTLISLTQSASGSTTGAVSGTISQTLPITTQDGSGTLTFSATSGQTIPSITQAAQSMEVTAEIMPIAFRKFKRGRILIKSHRTGRLGSRLR